VRHNPKHAVSDEAVVRRLIDENPWATIVSHNGDELVASHYPILLDDRAAGEQLTVVTHVGRPDERIHELGDSEVLLIVAGAHGYISPSWYSEGTTRVPTWNFSVAHCYGVPEILDPDENLRVLTRLVEHFERRVVDPAYLDPEVGARIAPGTVGLRIPITRFVCKVKMSQDKDRESQLRVLDELRGSGPYGHELLADEMDRALDSADRR
jgi:transcriptional regulator